MVAGHLRVQNGYWQMILSYKDSTGKRRTKSVTTHLKEKGNKLLKHNKAVIKIDSHLLELINNCHAYIACVLHKSIAINRH